MANYDLGTIGYTVQNTGAPKSIEELKQLAQAGIEVYRNGEKISKGQERLNQYFASIDKQITNVNRNIQKHSGYLNQAAQQSNRFGVATQQVGYQVGDFLVQVQSGTNWMVAFGQQATQLVGILPLLEGGFMGLSGTALVALSTGLGIAIPLITAVGAYFLRTGKDAEDGSGGITTYAGAIKALTEEIKKNQEEFLKIKFDTESSGIAGASQQIEDLEKRITSLNESIERMRSQGGKAAAFSGLALGSVDDLESQKAALEGQLFVLEAQSEAQRMLNGHLSTAKGLIAAETDERARHKAILDQINATENERKNIFHALAGESESVSKYMDESFQAGLKLSKLDMATPISDAAVQAQILADKLGISVGLAAEIGKIGGMTKDQSKIYSGVKSGALPPAALNSIGMDQSGFSEEGFSSPIQWMGLPSNPTTSRKKSGGGGAGITPLENKMEEIYQYLEADQYLIEQENIAYQQRQDTLQSALQQKIISIEEYNQIEKDLKTKHEYELSSIEQNAHSQRLNDAAGFFGALASVAQAGGGKMVKAAAIFSAAQGLINSYTAYTEMLKDPSFIGRPWARFAAAAGVLASGLQMVRAIKGVGGGGGGEGATGASVGGSISSVGTSSSTKTSSSVKSATVAQTTQQAPAPQTVYINSLEPDGLYSGQALINLFDAFYDENDKRGKVFVVAR